MITDRSISALPPTKRMQLTERHFYGTLICAQAQESLQLMRGPLDDIRRWEAVRSLTPKTLL